MNNRNGSKDIRLLKIKSAISDFLMRTQKLVKSVEPNAEIVIPEKLPQKRIRKIEVISKPIDRKIVSIPEFTSKIYLDRDQAKRYF